MGAQIHSVTAFPASAVSHDELNGIIAEHLALEHLRVFRRLIAARFGVAMLVILGVGAGFAWLPALVCIAILSAVLVWVRLAESRRERHLRHRLETLGDSRTYRIPSPVAMSPAPRAIYPSLHG